MSRKVDIHAHMLPESWPDLKQKYGYGGWINMHRVDDGYVMKYDDGRFFRKVATNLWNPKARLDDMNAAEVKLQILSTVPVLFSYWAKAVDALDFHRFLNDHLAGVVKQFPTRFAFMCTVPLQDPVLAAQELRRCVTRLGAKGVIIGSHVNAWNLDAVELDPFYKTAEELNCAIFVHPWDMEQGGRMSKYWMPWLVGMPAETTVAICSVLMGGVLEKFKRLKMCFAHGAGAFPYTVGRIQHGFNARPDLCSVANTVSPASYLGRFCADSLVMQQSSLGLLVNTLGEDNVMMGSDYPFPLGEINRPGQLIETSQFNQTVKNKMLFKNAEAFFGL